MNLTPDQLSAVESLKHAEEEDKCLFIKQLIIELVWTLENQRKVGYAWNIGPRALGLLAARANAMMLAAISDPEVLRAKLIEQAHFIVSDAMQKKKPFLDKEGSIIMAPDPDHKAALQGIHFIAKVSGLDKGKPAEKALTEYEKRSLPELLRLAQQKLLPEGQPLPSLEIQAEGEEAHEERNEAVETTLPSGSGRRDREERIRGGNTRRDLDPTGRGRGTSQEGGEA